MTIEMKALCNSNRVCVPDIGAKATIWFGVELRGSLAGTLIFYEAKYSRVTRIIIQ